MIITMCLALYIYEYLVTMDKEINSIWTRKWTLLTWIYAVNRYTILFGVLVNLAVPVYNYQVRNSVFIGYINAHFDMYDFVLYRGNTPFVAAVVSSSLITVY